MIVCQQPDSFNNVHPQLPLLLPLPTAILKTDLTLGEEDEYEAYEEYNTDTSSVFSSPPMSPQTPRFDPDRGLSSPASTSRLMNRAKTMMPQNRSFSTLTSSARTASTLTLSRWDWKTLFYNWNFPLDNVLLGLRRGNLSNSNSNLSVSSDGVESDDSSKPRLRANKVMRMGSFAYRATQFFENLGKKSTAKRKVSSLSAPSDATEYNLRDGIQEESSLSSVSIGGPGISPSSEAASPVFEDSFRNSSVFPSPSSTELPPLPSTPPPPIPVRIKQQGFLNIFSSFNKRRWGQRWCLVRENMFECYRNKTSNLCELNFLLRNCIIRQAMAETNSPLSLMLLENNKEKITVEPPSKEELSQWLRVLMVETATEVVPVGLEEYFVEVDDNQVDDFTGMDPEYSDIVSATVLKSWEIGSVPILPSKDKSAEDVEDKTDELAATDGAGKENSPEVDEASKDDEEPPQSDKYLYSAVIKRPSFPTLEQLDAAQGSKPEEPVTEEDEEPKIPRFTENLAVYNANKNTTDSGFYSVKEANSDSESGSEVKTDTVSPTQESCSLSESAKGPALTTCNKSGNGISDSVVGASGGVQALEEEEEEESALEKTMTPDDFKDNLDSGKDVVSPSSTANVSPTGDGKDGCENAVHRVSMNAEQDRSLQNSQEQDSAAGVVVTKENHVQSEKVDSQLASEDVQQRDKPKKKKKKGKSKKNKQKQHEREGTPSGSNPRNTADTVASNPKSPQSNQSSDNPQASGIPGCSTSSVECTTVAPYEPSAHRNFTAEDKLSDSHVHEPSISAPSPGDGEVEKTKGPEDDENIAELRDRIGKLREKLVQIKRKRDTWDQEFAEFLDKRNNRQNQTSGL